MADVSADTEEGITQARALANHFFPGFAPVRVTLADDLLINAVIGGEGPPLLLLHGFPQSLLEWRYLTAPLAQHFRVVAADLRGYGNSSSPSGGKDHRGYSKAAMAEDQHQLMQKLGFERFAVVGHDRGARVAHRLALEYPDAVSHLALIDIVPGVIFYDQLTPALARAYHHWFLLSQPAPLPETLYASNAEFLLRRHYFRGLSPEQMPEEALQVYLQSLLDPGSLHAMCEDYRAGATLDYAAEKADLEAGRKLTMPLLNHLG
jgi:haloacetate dehalogenase